MYYYIRICYTDRVTARRRHLDIERARQPFERARRRRLPGSRANNDTNNSNKTDDIIGYSVV